MIALSQQMGVESKEIQAFMRTQASNALSGFAAIAEGVGEPYRKLGEDVKKAREELDAADKAAEKARTSSQKEADQWYTWAQANLKKVTDATYSSAEARKKAIEEAESEFGRAARTFDGLNEGLTEGIRIGDDYEKALEGQTEAWRKLQDAQDRQIPFNREMREAREALTRTELAAVEAKKRAGDNATDEAYVKALADQKTAAEALLAVTEKQVVAQAAQKQELADLGTIAVGTFAAAIASGMSFGEALKAAAPGLNSLNQSYKDLGLNVEDAATKQLLLQASILEKTPKLIQGVDGLSSSMIGLSNMGMLNADTFEALQRTGMSLYQRLQGEVHNTAGASMTLEEKTRAALLPMQGYLQNAKEEAERLGIPLNANTQELINQSSPTTRSCVKASTSSARQSKV